MHMFKKKKIVGYFFLLLSRSNFEYSVESPWEELVQ